MITHCTIRNFQRIKKADLNFSQGLNLLSGESDQGKSAVLRSLRWLFMNKPSSDSFRPHGAKPDELTEVSVKIGNDTIYRVRDGKKRNEYILQKQGQKPIIFKALRGEVPDEIKEITGIDDINIQRQLDSLFLISLSPGEVARYLNRIVSLDAIDTALKKAAQLVSQARSWKNDTECRIEQLSSKINDLMWIDKASELAEAVEIIEERLVQEQRQITELRNLVKRIEDSEIPKDFWLPAALVTDIRNLDVQEIRELENLQQQITTLKSMISEIQTCERAEKEHIHKVSDLRKQIQDEESQIEYCPTCGRLME